DDEGAYFGYDKTSFGILHRRFGSIEIRTIEITSAADAGGGDFVITMDGTAVTVTVGASATISEVTAAIVAKTDDFANAGRGWLVHTDDNVNVEFISFVSENATGTFSFVDTDSGVTAGVFQQDTTEVEGSAPTETWVAQADWNADPLDGSGPSGLNFSTSNTEFSPSNLNIYQVTFQYLGAGPIKYYIENPSNGRLILVHTVVSAGVTENAVFRDPSLRLSVIIKTDTGYTGGALTVKTASMGGFVQGKQTDIGVNNSASGSKTTTTTTPINILTIHNEVDFLGKENKVNVIPSFMTVSALGGNKSVLIEIVEEPTEVGGTVALTKVDSANSPMEFDVAGTTIVGGTVIFPVIIESGQSKEIDLTRFGFVLRPGARWVITARLITTGTNAAVSVGVTWLERF
ncbi:hypothetical protein KAR91_76715, partial [Candidatus Pacearchaeota archaeon]|nr:hypothetical protein [Candidatus Pacearchaeota archaeon]